MQNRPPTAPPPSPALIDDTNVSVHPKASGAKGTRNQAIGRSKGRLTTKVLALTDALGNLARFALLPGQRREIVGVPGLIEGLTFGALLAGKAFEAERQNRRKLCRHMDHRCDNHRSTVIVNRP